MLDRVERRLVAILAVRPVARRSAKGVTSMKFELPTPQTVKEIADELGFPIDDDAEVADMLTFMAPFADAYNAVDEMPDELPPVKYPRGDWYRPEVEENKHGAWYIKVTIKGAGDGKLAGKRIAPERPLAWVTQHEVACKWMSAMLEAGTYDGPLSSFADAFSRSAPARGRDAVRHNN